MFCFQKMLFFNWFSLPSCWFMGAAFIQGWIMGLFTPNQMAFGASCFSIRMGFSFGIVFCDVKTLNGAFHSEIWLFLI